MNQEKRAMSTYCLPDGREVQIYDDVTRGKVIVDYTLENGEIVYAVRLIEIEDIMNIIRR